MSDLDTTTIAPKRRIHPLVATAAVSVTVLSLVGVGALTGLIDSPLAKSASPQAAIASALPTTGASTATASTATTSAAAAVASAEAGAQPQPQQQTQAHRPPQADAARPASPVAADRAPTAESPARQATRPAPSRPVASESPRRVQPPAAPVAAVDPNVGTVLSITRVEEPASGSGVGVIGGGVVGGVLGNQVGKGNGRKAMTVLGAIGGAVAGNAIEKKVRTETHYDVLVRLADGSTRTLRYADQPAFGVGERIRVDAGSRAS
ncbi:MAG: glycine zipper 2TM domain-containing protein [Lautropia sp.]